MNLYHFVGYNDEHRADYDEYVRAPDEATALRLIVDDMEWDDGSGQTIEEILAERCDLPGYGLELIKAYPAPGPAAGGIPYSEIKRILHYAL